MNCEEFDQSMQLRLDARQSLWTDRALLDHASRCEGCEFKMRTWSEIDRVMLPPRPLTPATDGQRSGRVKTPAIFARVIVGLAASVLIVMVMWPHPSRSIVRSPQEPLLRDVTADSTPAAAVHSTAGMALVAAEMDPATWWRGVQDHDWIGQTMPAVQSLREGVAPLGRSLRRAVTMLTIGGADSLLGRNWHVSLRPTRNFSLETAISLPSWLPVKTLSFTCIDHLGVRQPRFSWIAETESSACGPCQVVHSRRFPHREDAGRFDFGSDSSTFRVKNRTGTLLQGRKWVA